MANLTDKQIIEYLHRSYGALDGLWFMAAEQRFDFETALVLDLEVWKVLPKIQARKLKQLLGAAGGLDDLCRCLSEKLRIDGFDFSVEDSGDRRGFTLLIHRCPWYDLMVKSNRTALAGRVGQCICPAEYSAWAAEFGGNITFRLAEPLCQVAGPCRLRFEKDSGPTS